jgi:hypothetical protein
VKTSFYICAVILFGIAASCQEKGYRTEVYPGEQGQTQVRHIPVNEPAPTEHHTVVDADPDLDELRSLWPRLSSEDRKRVADMAKRLAK